MSDFTYDNSFYFAPVPAWQPVATVIEEAPVVAPAESGPILLNEVIALVLTALSYPFPEILSWARSNG